ncbi:MCM2/3/5 family-domain-containing protein [Entophlyctis helioformis]|nr:MCM2/3/5 family-domain-containing protein [Entophlyctis helioformis]
MSERGGWRGAAGGRGRGRGRGNSGGGGGGSGRGRGRGRGGGGGGPHHDDGQGYGRKRQVDDEHGDQGYRGAQAAAGRGGGRLGIGGYNGDIEQEINASAGHGSRPNPQRRRFNNDYGDDADDGAGPPRRRGVPSPYKFWDHYFPNDPYDNGHELLPLIFTFEAYFKRLFEARLDSEAADAYESLVTQPLVLVDYNDVLANTLADFEIRITSQPETILACMGLAASDVLLKIRRQPGHAHLLGDDDDDDPACDRKIVRIINFPFITPLKDLKSNLMGKFIAIRGTVVRVSSVKPMTTQMAFQCTKCNQTNIQVFQDGKFRMPTKCTAFGCRGKTLVPDRSLDAGTHTVDWQRIRVQEKLADDQVDAGRIPRTIECELVRDLVDNVVPGDVVSVSGTVKVLATEDAKKKNASTMYYLYLDANSLNKAGASSSDQQDDNGSDLATGLSKDYLQFSRKELYGIREIHEHPDVFKLLVHSLCPPIFGHEIVKAGLLLVLFGARRRDDEVQGVSIRSDPHILIVGDPGLGKSQMLSATVRAAPRGVYVSGNTTTTSGLTVTICKDADSNDTTLEAGALVLGDQGVCCIDEFDKMVEHQALLEAMEQQSISIAKAGIVCSLPARTSVIAAANPVGGHYNKAKTVSENLKMNGALLSRFDLVFILLDRPDEQMDMFLSDHIMKLHSGGFKSENERNRTNAPMFQKKSSDQLTGVSDKTLLERLRPAKDEFIDPIPPPLLRKYIAYARTYTKPRLTKEAARVLQRFYLTLRGKYRSIDSTPITTRQLESMIRLSEARARSELREEVTEQDAQDVVQIMKVSLWDTYEDDTGQIDFQRSQLGSGMSKRGEPKRFVAELQKVAQRRANNRFDHDELYAIAQEIRLKYDRFPDMVESLNIQGYLLKKGYKQYELSTAY